MEVGPRITERGFGKLRKGKQTENDDCVANVINLKGSWSVVSLYKIK